MERGVIIDVDAELDLPLLYTALFRYAEACDNGAHAAWGESKCAEYRAKRDRAAELVGKVYAMLKVVPS